MTPQEHIIPLQCDGDAMLAILNQPQAPAHTGVLFIVGGPQYRVGSHRQFVLLGRSLAQAGLATMRFDVRGMGDSEGENRSFDQLEDDIRVAVDAFQQAIPTLKHIVLWGLCDGATAACLYACSDQRIAGLILVNPWISNAASHAQAMLTHYYRQRLLSRAFWGKLLHGRMQWKRSVSALITACRGVLQPEPHAHGQPVTMTLAQRMLEALQHIHGPKLFILCPRDLTAQEFIAQVTRSATWQTLAADGKLTVRYNAEADHTFSTQAWHAALERTTLDWLQQHWPR